MFTLEQINNAYIKLKSYIYYDNTDILLRRQLVEFETNRTKDITPFFGGGPASLYNLKKNKAKTVSDIINVKLERITKELNEYHENSEFWDHWMDKIEASVYPKKIAEPKTEKNFITNKRVNADYLIDRETAFIKAPIEIHLLSSLWILVEGVKLDASLGDCTYGNRLLLNKDKSAVVQGSGLFKPYFKQYQKWRDESVQTAKNQLDKGKDVLFLNLDIRDYFHSVRIESSKLFNGNRRRQLDELKNLQELFLKIHQKYTKLICDVYKTPYDFSAEISEAKDTEIKEVILPIGLLSSYVLANDYLRDFDKRITEKIKPAYYGRYVDDILIVINDPNPDYSNQESLADLKFSFKKYKNKTTTVRNESISFDEKDMTILEKFVLENFYPVITLVDTPSYAISEDAKNEKIDKSFKLNGYPKLYCQSDKTLLYLFDHLESDLVIDKLKKELDARTSEFRDFPTEKENQETFEESAYHLLYDGTEGKIRTLKDYKENRFGLTIYLANRIFSALRHDSASAGEEVDQVLKFFRGVNCVTFYRLWERILTYFLVNNAAEAYVKFYLHCAEQIQKIRPKKEKDYAVNKSLHATMVDFLDCAHELAISLNPKFIDETSTAAKNFEFQINKIGAEAFAYFSTNFEPTRSDSFWVQRFRESNMIRHSYVIHPLLNFTTEAKKGWVKLTSLALDFTKYNLDPELIKNSPRPIKFWECSLAKAYEHIGKAKQTFMKEHEHVTTLLSIDDELNADLEKVGKSFYLDDAFELYNRINGNHSAEYILEDPTLRDKFYVRKTNRLTYDDITPVWGQEIAVNSTGRNMLNRPVIAFANTQIQEKDIADSVRNKPRLDKARYKKMAEILEKARKEKADMLLFPEFFTNINLLSSLVRYAAKNDVLVVTGLEHVQMEGYAYNFIVTILPVKVGGITDAVPVFRLKNHYAHAEEHLIEKYHFRVPRPLVYRYDVFNWKNIYFSSYYCFELANALHRSMFKSKLDLLIGVEWNKDTPYFSNIVEAGSRDLHLYVAQVNTSQYGDTRLTQPVETARKDILKLKGGQNDAILTGEIDIYSLREFQLKKYDSEDKSFKPLPPDFSIADVQKRISNKNVLT